jgi:hypothetical protein
MATAPDRLLNLVATQLGISIVACHGEELLVFLRLIER